MTPKQKAAQIYDQYWSAVSKRPASNKDPLPDIRPLIERALIAERKDGAEEEREAIKQLLSAREAVYRERMSQYTEGSDYHMSVMAIEWAIETIRARS